MPGPNLKQRLLLINSCHFTTLQEVYKNIFILNFTSSMDPVYVDSASGVVVQRTAVSCEYDKPF